MKPTISADEARTAFLAGWDKQRRGHGGFIVAALVARAALHGLASHIWEPKALPSPLPRSSAISCCCSHWRSLHSLDE